MGLYLLPLLVLFVQGCFGAEYGIRVWLSGYSLFKKHSRISGRIQGNHILSGCFLRQYQIVGPFLVVRKHHVLSHFKSLHTFSLCWNSIIPLPHFFSSFPHIACPMLSTHQILVNSFKFGFQVWIRWPSSLSLSILL